ncbi:MAG: VWA domain-containing protein [Paraglaciecola sp.]|nr:VWA domain-containing protein [Paraglaciecola sp.]NCT48286.1 VWA domain-containing protein [Paraglaciecola sp.]
MSTNPQLLLQNSVTTPLSTLALCLVIAISGCTTDAGKHDEKLAKTDKNNAILAPELAVHDVALVRDKKIEKVKVEGDGEGEALALHAEMQQRQGMMMSMARQAPASMMVSPTTAPLNSREIYQNLSQNGIKQVKVEPVSTFSIDVDTGSYANVRRMLNQGVIPPSDSVRTEEFINYFDYHYPLPNNLEQPFLLSSDIASAPWHADKHLLRIALKGYQPPSTELKGRNLVFLLDVSGSMKQANKLPLLTRSLQLLSAQLNADDSVSIVVYAGASGVVLEPTRGDQQAKIAAALLQLQAGGATNGAAGIELAYQLAAQSFKPQGVNRVILATDGDFNVGIADHQQLIDLIKRHKQQGIALTTLGFGEVNYNDYLMEQLADAGNGNYAYIDTLQEARKVLVDELNATMQIIAKDVKIQVEFNPNTVSEYRLIGYENRALRQEDFNNDKVDAGEIGAGHTVTAFYEVTLVGAKHTNIDPLRYQLPASTATDQDKNEAVFADELAWVKLRYKDPQGDTSKLISQVVKHQHITTFAQQGQDFRFASAVLGFAQQLRQSNYASGMDYQQIESIARESQGEDHNGYRAEFLRLVQNAKSLRANVPTGTHSMQINQDGSTLLTGLVVK